MTKRKIRVITPIQSHRPSILPSWDMTAFSIFLWAGAIFTGFYFEASFLPMTAVSFIVLGLYFWFAQKLPWSILHIVVILFVLSYWIACIYALDVEAAVLEAFKVSNLIPLIFILSRIRPESQFTIKKQLVGLAVFMIVIGWIFELNREGRLESTLEYANTFALILLLALWYVWEIIRHGRNLYYGISIPILLIGLFQTGSRAVLVLFALGCCILLIYYLYRIYKQRIDKQRINLYLLFGSIVVAIASVVCMINSLISSEIATRLITWGWNTPEFALRRVYWQDAWDLIKANWMFGYGGGGWAVLRPSWYYVKYVHQHFLQVILDVGLVGFICFKSMIAAPMLQSWKKVGLIHWYPLTIFVLHAGFDISLVYPLVMGIFLFIIYNLYSAGGAIPSRMWPKSLSRGFGIICFIVAILMFWQSILI